MDPVSIGLTAAATAFPFLFQGKSPEKQQKEIEEAAKKRRREMGITDPASISSIHGDYRDEHGRVYKGGAFVDNTPSGTRTTKTVRDAQGIPLRQGKGWRWGVDEMGNLFQEPTLSFPSQAHAGERVTYRDYTENDASNMANSKREKKRLLDQIDQRLGGQISRRRKGIVDDERTRFADKPKSFRIGKASATYSPGDVFKTEFGRVLPQDIYFDKSSQLWVSPDANIFNTDGQNITQSLPHNTREMLYRLRENSVKSKNATLNKREAEVANRKARWETGHITPDYERSNLNKMKYKNEFGSITKEGTWLPRRELTASEQDKKDMKRFARDAFGNWYFNYNGYGRPELTQANRIENAENLSAEIKEMIKKHEGLLKKHDVLAAASDRRLGGYVKKIREAQQPKPSIDDVSEETLTTPLGEMDREEKTFTLKDMPEVIKKETKKIPAEISAAGEVIAPSRKEKEYIITDKAGQPIEKPRFSNEWAKKVYEGAKAAHKEIVPGYKTSRQQKKTEQAAAKIKESMGGELADIGREIIGKPHLEERVMNDPFLRTLLIAQENIKREASRPKFKNYRDELFSKALMNYLAARSRRRYSNYRRRYTY